MMESTAVYNLAFESEEDTFHKEAQRNGKSKGENSCTLNSYSSASTSPEGPKDIDPACACKRVSFVGDGEPTNIKLYKKRFWMLGLFSVCSMLNAAQWMEYTIVSDVTMCFYNVDISAVNWTANLYLILYAPLVFPVSWFTDKMGIRNSLLVGSFLTCIGTGIQCRSTTPDGFTYALVSQAFASVGQVFILALPPQISATWFGANELSRASAVGVFGNQLGCALGFIFSPLVISKDCSDKALITKGKEIVAYTLLGCNLVVFFLILSTFRAQPEKPPSIAQAKKLEDENNYKRSICALLKNLHFDLLLVSYGIVVGIYFAVSTILNSVVSVHFPGRDTEIGWMGLIAILSGTIASVIAGYILDWTHRYKETSIAIFIFSFGSMILFGGLLYTDILWLQFLSIAILGFFLTSYLPVGFEFAVEITYPESESISAQLLNTSTMVFGLVFTVIASDLVTRFNDVAANAFFCVLLLLGTVLIAIVKCDFRRMKQKAESEENL